MPSRHEAPEELTSEDIERKIAETEEELKEVRQERRLTLGGTAVHIGGKKAARLRDEFEEEEARLKSRLEELRSYL